MLLKSVIITNIIYLHYKHEVILIIVINIESKFPSNINVSFVIALRTRNSPREFRCIVFSFQVESRHPRESISLHVHGEQTSKGNFDESNWQFYDPPLGSFLYFVRLQRRSGKAFLRHRGYLSKIGTRSHVVLIRAWIPSVQISKCWSF